MMSGLLTIFDNLSASLAAVWPLLGLGMSLTWIVMAVTVFRHDMVRRWAATAFGCALAAALGWVTLANMGHTPALAVVVMAGLVAALAAGVIAWSVGVSPHTASAGPTGSEDGSRMHRPLTG